MDVRAIHLDAVAAIRAAHSERSHQRLNRRVLHELRNVITHADTDLKRLGGTVDSAHIPQVYWDVKAAALVVVHQRYERSRL